MHRHVVRHSVISLLLLSVVAAPAVAQRGGPHWSVAVGGSALNVGASAQPSSAISAAAVALGVEREFGHRWGGQFLVRALVPTSVEAVQPSCLPGASCSSRSSPSGLFSASFHVVRRTASRALGASIGAGVLTSRETAPGPRTAPLGDVGVSWRPAAGSRASLEVAVHAALLSRRVSGMRGFLLPTIGVAF